MRLGVTALLAGADRLNDAVLIASAGVLALIRAAVCIVPVLSVVAGFIER